MRAWMVTSAVGSSAMRMSGVAGKRHGDRDALAHAAGGAVADALFGVGDAHHVSSTDAAMPRPWVTTVRARPSQLAANGMNQV